MHDFQRLRKEYEDVGFDEVLLGDSPIAAFHVWMKAAVDHSPGSWFEPNAMTLATADIKGHVTARIVLLKSLDHGKFVFFTNYESDKGVQLALNHQASLVFYWPYLDRQVRIEGSVDKTSREISEKYFQSRPRRSQIAAAVSDQSTILASRQKLLEQAIELELRLQDAPVPCPEHWGGYALTPHRIEFWQGRTDRMHDRIVFESQIDGTWKISRLSP